MKVSVVIPHYNDLESLELCLAALDQQTFPADQREIIVADNNSPQGQAAVAAIISGRALLVNVLEKGAGPARNGGVAVSRGEIIAFTDADCRPDPDWLVKGVSALEGYDFVGGRIVVSVRNSARVTPCEAFESVFAFDAETYVLHKGFAATCNLFCRRVVFDSVGAFGNGISEDVDWSHRAGAQGLRIGYAPDAIVRHPARVSWQELRRKWTRINAETYALALRRPAGRTKWIFRSMMLPLSAAAHTGKVLRSPRIRGARARLEALFVLYRLRLWRTADAFRLVFRKS